MNPSTHLHSVPLQANVHCCQVPVHPLYRRYPQREESLGSSRGAEGNLWRQGRIRVSPVGLPNLYLVITFIVSVEHIPLRTNRQKESWFINTLNPNGRIPVLVDRNRPSTTGAEGFAVFETAAILLYLSQHYDPEHKLWFDVAKQPEHYSEMLQWIFFAVRPSLRLEAGSGADHFRSMVVLVLCRVNVSILTNPCRSQPLTLPTSKPLQQVRAGGHPVCQEASVWQLPCQPRKLTRPAYRLLG